MRKINSSLLGGLAWRVWLLALWLAGGGAHAEDRYVQPGALITTWDTFTHRSNTNLSTFPDNCSGIVGMTRRKNGNVACLFNIGISSSAPRSLVFYEFSIDPSKSPPWKIVAGPHILDFHLPGWMYGGLSGGITEFTHDRFILTGYGAFPLDGEHFQPKYYLLIMDESTWQPAIYHEFPTNMHSVLSGFGEIAYLPSDGKEPAVFVIATQRDYAVFDAGGAHVRTITGQSLGLSYRIDQNYHHGSLEACDNGDLLAVDDDETVGSPGVVDWPHVVCVRFDRYGKLKGSWGLGAAIAAAPPEAGFSSLAQLSNGDCYVSAIQAFYLVGADNPEAGNAHTYRHFILRPPASFSQPVLDVSPTNLVFPRKIVGRTHTATARLANPGSSPLHLYSLTLSGDTNVFRVGPLKTMTLEPGYGRLDGADSSQDCVVTFNPSQLGHYSAQLAIRSGDPVNPSQTVDISGFAVPARFSLPILLETTNIWSAPNHPTGFCLSADGTSLLFMLAVRATDGVMRGRVAQMPLVRDVGGKITAINTAAATNVCDLPQYSNHALRQGGDGTLWYGPMSPGNPFLFQRTSAGAVRTWTLTNSTLGAPMDLLFLPGATSLAVIRAWSQHVERYDLVNTAGVITPVYNGVVGSSLPTYLRSFELWLDGASVYALMYQINGELWLVQTPASALAGGHSAEFESALVSNDHVIQAMAHDARSGDVLLLDSYGRLLRMSGYLDFLKSITLMNIGIVAGKIKFCWEAEAGKTYRIQTNISLSEMAWQTVRELQASSATAEFSETASGAHERYYRVLMIP